MNLLAALESLFTHPDPEVRAIAVAAHAATSPAPGGANMTESAVLTFTDAELSKPLVLDLPIGSFSLPFTGTVTVDADSPAGSVAENVTATTVIDGLSLPVVTLASFPDQLTGAIATAHPWAAEIINQIIKTLNGKLELVVTAS